MNLHFRPHHIQSFINFNQRKSYKMSDDNFVEDFCKRNVKMGHNRDFIVYWKKFLSELRKNPEKQIICANKPDIICKNCDIKDKCLKKGTELYDIAKRLDEKAKIKYSISDGDVFTVNDFLFKRP